jgi:hypothetical protein
MKKRSILAVLMVSGAAVMCSGLTFEIGAIGGGGQDFAWGTYFDEKAAQVAEMGSSGPGSPGSSQIALFLGWSAGAYADLYLFPWLGVRVEPRISMQGGAYTGLTGASVPFERYGVFYYSVILPAYVRGRIPLGPGFAVISAGGFYGVVVGDVMESTQYVSSLTTSSAPQIFPQGEIIGVSGGLGYSLPFGPGIASLELRGDWVLFGSATLSSADTQNEILPLAAALMVGYGFALGGAR